MARAEQRVWRLIQDFGIWPGIIECDDGYRLTYDPATSGRDLSDRAAD